MESIRGDPELASEMVLLLGRELKNARKTIADLKERLEQNDDEEKILDLKRVKKEMKKRIKELTKAAHALQTRVEELELAEQAASVRLQDLEGALHNQKSNIESEVSLKSSMNKIQDLQLAEEHALQKVDELREREKVAQQHIEQLGKENQKLQTNIEGLEHANEVAERKMRELEANDRGLANELEALRRAAQVATTRIADLESVDQSSKIRINELKFTIEQAEEKTKVLGHALSEQREKNSALKTELENAECAIDILKLNVEKINYENRWLHGELNNATVKKEEPEERSLTISSNPKQLAISESTDREQVMEPHKSQKKENISIPTSEELQLQMKVNSSYTANGSTNIHVNTFGHLPTPLSRPSFTQLSPVSFSNTDLLSYLALDPTSQCSSQNFMYFPKRLMWYEPKVHAVAFGPCQVYKSTQHRWTDADEFTLLHGRIQELFFLSGSWIYYAGSYQCYRIHEEGPSLPKDISADIIVDVARGPDQQDSDIYSQYQDLDKRTLSKLYSDGVLKTECLALQCVGFNTVLYNVLLQRFTRVMSLKRRGDHSDLGAVTTKKSKSPQ